MRRHLWIGLLPVLLTAACSTNVDPVTSPEPVGTYTLTSGAALTMATPDGVGTDLAGGDGICPDDPTAILLVDGVILTVDATDSQFSSVLVEGGRITAVGDLITVPDGACVIDLHGRTAVEVSTKPFTDFAAWARENMPATA